MIAAGKVEHIPETSSGFEEGYDPDTHSPKSRILSHRKLFNLAVYDEIMWKHVTNPKIVNIIMDLMGTSDIKLYGDQLFMKPPEIGSEIPWHQDSASWSDIFPMNLVSAWMAIDNATEENGCLRYIPGTHRMGIFGNDDQPRVDRVKPFSKDFGNSDWPIVYTPLRPGSIVFHHSLTLHGSAANISGKRRRGYSIHYMGATSWKQQSNTTAPKMPPFKQVIGRSFLERV